MTCISFRQTRPDERRGQLPGLKRTEQDVIVKMEQKIADGRDRHVHRLVSHGRDGCGLDGLGVHLAKDPIPLADLEEMCLKTR